MMTAPMELAPNIDVSAQPADEVIDAVRQAMNRLLGADRRLRGRDLRQGNALTHAHFRALFTLTEQPALTAGALARAAELNPASVTAMVDQLEARGLVARRRDDQDRRVCWISLTPDGHREVNELRHTWHAMLRHGFADISDDDILTAVLVIHRIADLMERVVQPEEAAGDSLKTQFRANRG
jgi:DNA-binding MarR family transcriptional regulator